MSTELANTIDAALYVIKYRTQSRYDVDSFRWGTYENIWLKIQDIKDSHLANIVIHAIVEMQDVQLAVFMYQQAKLRGLTDDYIKTNHPFQDQLGRWMIWDFGLHRPVPAARLAKPVQQIDVEVSDG